MGQILVVLVLLAAPALAANRTVDLRDLDRQKVAEISFQHLAEKPITNRQLRAAMRIRVEERFARRFFRADM